MTEPEKTEDSAPEPRKRSAYRFRSSAPRPSPDEARRQNLVVQSAWRFLQNRDKVITFLNSHDEALGSSPLQLALTSDDGLLAVITALSDRFGEPGAAAAE